MAKLPLPRGAEGLASLTELPSDGWAERWDRIIVPDGIKNRLLNFGAFFFGPRARYSPVGLPVHGLIVLQGSPGVGKTTLAGGFAAKLAETVDGGSLLFLVIDSHALPSQLLGESQRSVARLFERTLADVAALGRPTVVLLDEVEALAVNRAGASLETNPVDVHRATNALLAGMDHVAAACRNVLFVATTNHAAGVDPAFLSRADLVEEIRLPGVEAVEAILRDTLREVRPGFASLEPRLHAFAAACHERGLDSRRLRKVVVRAIVRRHDLAVDPALLEIDDLNAALDEDEPWSAHSVAGESRLADR